MATCTRAKKRRKGAIAMGAQVCCQKPISKGRVCVTGANGFIAVHVVKILLEQGYIVHGTVRSLSDPMKVTHLKALKGAEERLKLFEADLLKPGSFKDAIAGVSCVFHMASPVFFKGTNIDNMIRPALEGTENVLQTCNETPSVDRVVLTASTASIYCHGDAKKDTKYVWSEKDWSDEKSMRAANAHYPLGKTLAERRAWEISKKAKWSLVVMNPTVVWGPLLQPKINESSTWLLVYLDGTQKKIDNKARTIVDVRDVALAHIRAFQRSEAKGRYMLVGHCISMLELCKILRSIQPWNRNIPDKLGKVPKGKVIFGTPAPNLTLFTNAKANEELGIQFRDPSDTIKASVESFSNMKLIEAKQK
mmetsp:Transcript_17904/g.26811  ORF Transcript_17904/g.26811 Transcript_17904/m.26811 type:complete len:363 (+) Transcript_17904:790-1878(+)|eukprot:CAMPEP_0167756198 /NCGR_PEP_ID=MMETSP0110_2-20121227/9249_1 /TAXON_ID=629695 /ORGANISM="Gymnochlora sp., Strain CCMP2014" /LENGTH=362 /DNA_ID=CAMNT_0007642275 /DNA_START=725 /DNA_END=1813 /DNA_ORIENTATION=-